MTHLPNQVRDHNFVLCDSRRRLQRVDARAHRFSVESARSKRVEEELLIARRETHHHFRLANDGREDFKKAPRA